MAVLLKGRRSFDRVNQSTLSRVRICGVSIALRTLGLLYASQSNRAQVTNGNVLACLKYDMVVRVWGREDS